MNTLYEPSFEHESCGIGAVVSIDGIKSHDVVDKALSIVERLEHRAGKDAEGKTGDGVGILLQVNHGFFKAACERGEIVSLSGKACREIGAERNYGIGMFFFTPGADVSAAQKCFEKICAGQKLTVPGWRKVPVNPDVLGSRARDCMPSIIQAFIAKPEGCAEGLAFDKILYQVRLEFEKDQRHAAYVCSMSSRTVVYKGMFLVGQLRSFYKDLQSPEYESALALVHSRFSTNTNPSWERAHPNRIIAHNGEINTIRGNADRMIARSGQIDLSGSDSAMLDNTLEYFTMNGMELPLAVMVCIPQVWKHDDTLSQEVKDFYHYWGTMMESWDGPAAILFSDGDLAGATLDRNGLRPSRYYITKDNLLILSSEVGVLEIPEEQIVKKSRLMPGKMLLVDTKAKRLISDEEIKRHYAQEHPYGEWLSRNLIQLSSLKIPNHKIPVASQEDRDRLYKAFGWSLEDVNEMILPMAKNGIEPVGAMGADTPLAVLSEKHPPLFSYFRQLFAQVTNPPMDSLREKIVTDSTVYVGKDGDLLNPKGSCCRVLEIHNPILTGTDLLKISAIEKPGLRVKKVSLLTELKDLNLEKALDNIFSQIDQAYSEGFHIVILSDRGVDKDHAAVPSLLAVSAVEQYLIRTRRRTEVSVILESGEVRDVHQAALCLGYGARAVNPYLAHECIAELIDKKLLDKDYHTAIDDYNRAIMNGIIKIAAKMGISTLQSYQSAQIFEALGISKEVTDKYFTNTVSRIGGVGLEQIQQDMIYHHSRAYTAEGEASPFASSEDSASLSPKGDTPLKAPDNRLIKLDPLGIHKYKLVPGTESHLITPELIALLQDSTREGDYDKFLKYAALSDKKDKPFMLRDLLDFDYSKVSPVSLDEVESEDSIVRHFKTGAMSYGSISEEAHKCLAIAMNRLHGKSNSGEGGENPERLGTESNSAIKQVASGRFGVTEEYLLSATEIQIKLAQGAKPGEGGHLPGKKVYPWIARVRYSTPGVSLISPPPHHDIYSIEDLAQLIYDLKNASPKARISVKLVSEAGVGTIAAGVAKAGAHVILISGHDGGTGAAPLSSIHHAGLPWEMGLTETHQTLIQNGLRNKVLLETDGKLMTGRDVAVAALMGAQEFGFATAPLIVMGCKMLRVCSMDTCPFGVATQNEKNRARFPGKPEYVENYMRFVARQLRQIMAELGLKTLDEMCGRSDLLALRTNLPEGRGRLLDLSRLLAGAEGRAEVSEPAFNGNGEELKDTVDAKELLKRFEKDNGNALKNAASLRIKCTDRTLGTLLGSEIQKKYGSSLEDDAFRVDFEGGAGQSFGAFIPKGLTLRLTGDVNDGAGKGLSGGKIVIRAPQAFKETSQDNIIAGNAAFFGATSGRGFVNGSAGERFCVRNSGAVVVCEGTGDHALEYMTGGTAVILGPSGKNVAAGMSGGTAYILDEKHDLYKRLNSELVTMYDLDDETTVLKDKTDEEYLKQLIEEHVRETDSVPGKKILADWNRYRNCFKKVIPDDYLKIMNGAE